MTTYRIKLRQNTAAIAATDNPVLLMGEPGMETDTGKWKLGDGVTAWLGLPYESSPVVGTTAGTVAAGDDSRFAAAALIVEGVNTVATSGSAQTIPAVTAATISRITLTASPCVLTFPALAAGKSFTLVLVQNATGTRLVTWPAGIVKWAGGVAPVLSVGANMVDYLTFTCVDGATWAGFVAGKDVH